MFIVDTQVHIWAPETPERPWIPGGAERVRHMGHRAEPIGFEELRGMMDASGVARVLICPPTWEGDRVDLGLQAAKAYPERFGVMARVPLDRPEEAKALILSWRGEPGIKGVRLTFSFERERDWIKDGTADWYWPFAEAHDIPTMLLIPHAKRELASIAKRHPKLRLTVDHMGILGNTTDEAILPYVAATEQLAEFPNICVKLSNLPSFSTQKFPYANLNPVIERLVRAFGPRRCFWGTDLSRMIGRYHVGYPEAIDHVLHHLPFLSESDKEWIMGRAVCDWLRWPPGGASHA
jgi:predicted TIM-barrel fold metal-dependent hydrolase